MNTSWGCDYPGPGPSHRAIAPGRVNIIGEHVDHQKYSVLPCAISKSIVIDVLEQDLNNEPALQIRHAEAAKFPPQIFQTVNDIKISKTHTWSNYVVAAYLGVVEYFAHDKDADKVGLGLRPLDGLDEETIELARRYPESPVNRSFKLLVDGNIPAAAGLSSSSALVCCAAMSWNCNLSPDEISRICANCERYVGTAGGGMDQAAICLCEEGSASHISFYPLRASKIQLPIEVELVIANTCRQAPKVRDAAKMYNKRVFELKIGCLAIIGKHDPVYASKISVTELLNLGLRDVCQDILKMSEKDLLAKLTDYLKDAPLNKEDVNQILDIARREELLERRCGKSVWEQNEEFYPYLRVKHVLTEKLRVDRFVDLCRANVVENKPTDQGILRALGQLMNESQGSLRDLYDCSCEELDDLVNIARESGALGARLTGAGWGGCTVSLVPTNEVDNFIQQVKNKYYLPLMEGTKKCYKTPLEYLPNDPVELQRAIFATKPTRAAKVNKLKYPF